MGDASVLSPRALIIPAEEWTWLCRSAEQLAEEATKAEALLLDAADKVRVLGIPSRLLPLLFSSKPPKCQPATVTRCMRFDFHPTAAGWRVSEINSDVPGGWTEATEFPKLYQPFNEGMELPPSPLEAWSKSIRCHLPGGGRVALLSAPGFLEDQQVIFAFMRELTRHNIQTAAIQNPNALQWGSNGSCSLGSTGQPIHAVVRFYQLEWLARLNTASRWRELLLAQAIPVTNPTVSALSESKRFPLAFDDSAAFPTWRALFPECRDPRDVPTAEWDEWVLKATYSNAGDAVYICAHHSKDKLRKLVAKALSEPLKWVAQRRFETATVESERALLRPCVGVYVVDGKAAGAYVRLASGPITDGSAQEAPLFIEPAL